MVVAALFIASGPNAKPSRRVDPTPSSPPLLRGGGIRKSTQNGTTTLSCSSAFPGERNDTLSDFELTRHVHRHSQVSEVHNRFLYERVLAKGLPNDDLSERRRRRKSAAATNHVRNFTPIHAPG